MALVQARNIVVFAAAGCGEYLFAFDGDFFEGFQAVGYEAGADNVDAACFLFSQFREYIRSAVSANTPMDAFAQKMLTAKGGHTDDPASVYLTISKDTNDTIERVTQVFCGVRMLCARCHSHPMENWTQADYFGLVSFFTQVSARQDVRFPNLGNTKFISVMPRPSVSRT